MRVVVAPDTFKGTASADQVAAAIAAGWSRVRPDDEVRQAPMADGGEGTLEALAAAVPGARRMPVHVEGPGVEPVDAQWLLLPDGTGVVELAATSGIVLLEQPAPLDAHTVGFGQAITAALDAGVERLLLAVGGSASTDGGAGMLTALGARLLDAHGRPVERGGRGLGAVARIDLTALRALPPAGAVVLGDVVNPLTGPNGAAHVFGAQKGADEPQRLLLDAALMRWAEAFDVDPSTPGAGAAGGTGFGALVWGAGITSGARVVAEAIGLPEAIAAADLVITGEGRYDGQTAGGKAPAVVRDLAAASSRAVALVAGDVAVPATGFIAARSLVELAGNRADALRDPARWLHAAGASLAEQYRRTAGAR